MLDDDLWRLEKIGKDGVFHTRMNSEGIKTVQDFLKLAVIDTHKLRKVFLYLYLKILNSYFLVNNELTSFYC